MSQAAVATPQTEKMLSRKEGSVGYVIFNNPERHNAVSLDMWQAAGEMLDDFRNDNNIRVVVVTGAGGKAFVSGADISHSRRSAPTRTRWSTTTRSSRRATSPSTSSRSPPSP